MLLLNTNLNRSCELQNKDFVCCVPGCGYMYNKTQIMPYTHVGKDFIFPAWLILRVLSLVRVFCEYVSLSVENSTVHVWMIKPAIHNNPQNYGECYEYVLMFVYSLH